MNIEMPKGNNNENKESAMEAELNRLKKNEQRVKILGQIDYSKKEISKTASDKVKANTRNFIATLTGYASAIGGSVAVMDRLNQITSSMDDLNFNYKSPCRSYRCRNGCSGWYYCVRNN